MPWRVHIIQTSKSFSRSFWSLKEILENPVINGQMEKGTRATMGTRAESAGGTRWACGGHLLGGAGCGCTRGPCGRMVQLEELAGAGEPVTCPTPGTRPHGRSPRAGGQRLLESLRRVRQRRVRRRRARAQGATGVWGVARETRELLLR